jgi:hypothetical protein
MMVCESLRKATGGKICFQGPINRLIYAQAHG